MWGCEGVVRAEMGVFVGNEKLSKFSSGQNEWVCPPHCRWPLITTAQWTRPFLMSGSFEGLYLIPYAEL